MTRIIYLSPSATRPWLAMKYAQALSEGGAEIKVFSTPENIEGFANGYVRSDVEFRIFPANWYIPLVWRLEFLRRWRTPLPSWSLLRALLAARADIYIAGQPSDLPIAALAARLCGGELVYMPFEYYPGLSYGTADFHARNWAIEKRYAPRLKCWISMGETVAETIKRDYRLGGPIEIVYSSVPRMFDWTPAGLRQRLDAGRDWIIALYQGQISRNRGLWDVVRALIHVPENVHFVAIGGNENAALIAEAQSLGVSHRVHVLDFVPQNVLMGYTLEADIGLIPIHPVCQSYRFANPGKLFEFMAAGLPLAVSALDQLTWYVRDRGMGEVFAPEDPKDLARALTKLATDHEYRRQCAAAVRRVHDTEACWELQAEKLRAAILGPQCRSRIGSANPSEITVSR